MVSVFFFRVCVLSRYLQIAIALPAYKTLTVLCYFSSLLYFLHFSDWPGRFHCVFSYRNQPEITAPSAALFLWSGVHWILLILRIQIVHLRQMIISTEIIFFIFLSLLASSLASPWLDLKRGHCVTATYYLYKGKLPLFPHRSGIPPSTPTFPSYRTMSFLSNPIPSHPHYPTGIYHRWNGKRNRIDFHTLCETCILLNPRVFFEVITRVQEQSLGRGYGRTSLIRRPVCNYCTVHT